VVEYKNRLRVSIDFRENSNQGAVFDYIRQFIKLFIFQSLLRQLKKNRYSKNWEGFKIRDLALFIHKA